MSGRMAEDDTMQPSAIRTRNIGWAYATTLSRWYQSVQQMALAERPKLTMTRPTPKIRAHCGRCCLSSLELSAWCVCDGQPTRPAQKKSAGTVRTDPHPHTQQQHSHQQHQSKEATSARHTACRQAHTRTEARTRTRSRRCGTALRRCRTHPPGTCRGPSRQRLQGRRGSPRSALGKLVWLYARWVDASTRSPCRC